MELNDLVKKYKRKKYNTLIEALIILSIGVIGIILGVINTGGAPDFNHEVVENSKEFLLTGTKLNQMLSQIGNIFYLFGLIAGGYSMWLFSRMYIYTDVLEDLRETKNGKR